MITNKKHFEKKVIRFYEREPEFVQESMQEFRLTTKKELVEMFQEYKLNLQYEDCAASMVDDNYQIAVKTWNQMQQKYDIDFLDSWDSELSVKQVKESPFILHTNPIEFMAWVGDGAALEQFAGEFSREKYWVEL
ncbi:MAG: hypothetical protein GY801_36010 [bacterium]|nr:hypothetical protein [bacterium]